MNTISFSTKSKQPKTAAVTILAKTPNNNARFLPILEMYFARKKEEIIPPKGSAAKIIPTIYSGTPFECASWGKKGMMLEKQAFTKKLFIIIIIRKMSKFSLQQPKEKVSIKLESDFGGKETGSNGSS